MALLVSRTISRGFGIGFRDERFQGFAFFRVMGRIRSVHHAFLFSIGLSIGFPIRVRIRHMPFLVAYIARYFRAIATTMS